jgi:dimethylhistidine N-methyltransferase
MTGDATRKEAMMPGKVNEPQAIQTPESQRRQFLDDVLEGLSQPRKQIPCKYFYDARGSQLFDQICELEEYYVTRTEVAIMERRAPEMADHIGPRCQVVEPGAGAGAKTRILLASLDAPVAYVPIDISQEYLQKVVAELRESFPTLELIPVCADFTEEIELPGLNRSARRTIAYFPGSTIGNFKPAAAASFLARLARVGGTDGAVLLGADLKKSRDILEAAYDDSSGVTAAFNLNLLLRANRELGSDFEVDAFRHRATYDEGHGRVELYLVSQVDQTVSVAGRRLRFSRGETILTELSHKYAPEDFVELGASAGLRVERIWTDPDRLFSVQLLVPVE